MADYRLWYVRDAQGVRGPFPEPLVCRYLLLGRFRRSDQVSLDGSYWREIAAVPELQQALRQLLEAHGVPGDARWSEERAQAALRWLDERKAPDPRHAAAGGEAHGDERRSGDERRRTPEPQEQLVYRELRGTALARLRGYRERYGRIAAGLALAGLAVLALLLWYEPVRPVPVNLQLGQVDCAAPAGQGVRWSGCRKDGAQLAGADLRKAELVGTLLRQASLAGSDLRGANLLHADLAGADLVGARLDQAVWVDGRICAAGSLGRCR